MAVPLFILERDRAIRPKRRILLEHLSDAEIQTRTGLPSWGVREIIPVFDELEGQRGTAIPLETKVLTFLSFLRSGSVQWMVSGNSVSQPSTSRIIEDCSNLLVKNWKEIIKFPVEVNDTISVKKGIYEIAGFPNVIGVIDGTQCAIKGPTIDESAYVCRKGFHSINVQVVVNHLFEITDVVIKWPGSTHDSFIWNNSLLRSKLLARPQSGGWLLGMFAKKYWSSHGLPDIPQYHELS